MVAENIKEVRKRIDEACKRVGRNPCEVTLIAVSKTKPAEMIQEAVNAGQLIFGENKVQEILEKKPKFPDSVEWHMIGHLQRNKVKPVIDKVKLIHSVDSYRLAEQIQEEADKLDIDVDVLLEINVAAEESKYGFSANEVEMAVRQIAQLSRVHVQGFMTIAPFVENPEDNRIYFKKLYQIFIDIATKNIDNVNMRTISMGMTNDYEVAVEEGATMVRVGTGIFGQRQYR